MSRTPKSESIGVWPTFYKDLPPIVIRNRLWLLIFSLVLAVAFVSGITDFLLGPSMHIRWPEKVAEDVESDRYVPSYTTQQGGELVMVYLGSSTCAYANHPEMPAVVERAKLALQQKAQESGLLFSTVGVSIDWDTKKGVDHLAKFGLFDEIVTGRKWQGIGAHQFLWTGLSATPQVLVVFRMIRTSTPELPHQSYHVSGNTEMIRKVGVAQINNWVVQGTPLALDRLAQSTHPGPVEPTSVLTEKLTQGREQ